MECDVDEVEALQKPKAVRQRQSPFPAHRSRRVGRPRAPSPAEHSRRRDTPRACARPPIGRTRRPVSPIAATAEPRASRR
eukprot:7375958-Prymnesium_polylepis.1